MNQAYEFLAALDQQLRTRTQPPGLEYREMFGMLQYHLGWVDAEGNATEADMGKRIRPLICMWACHAVGADWRDALSPAAAIELIHNFSLIHDDIQDNSLARRGRATVWNVWGVAQSINAGDAMFVLAHQAMNDLPPHLSLERYGGIRRTFDAAILELTKGQYLDLAYERADQVTIDHYLTMVKGKTAALLAAACEIGARLGTSDARLHRTFSTYGQNLGIAFQIADDVLGIWGDPELTGKSARTDLVSRKKSYPLLFAMQDAEGKELRALYAKPKLEDRDILQVQKILEDTDARAVSLAHARDYALRAETALDATGLDNTAVTVLREFAVQVIERDK